MFKKFRFFSMFIFLFLLLFLYACDGQDKEIIESIEVDTSELMDSYEAGVFDVSTLTLVVHFAGGITQRIPITESMISLSEYQKLLTPGTHEIKISYLGLEATFSITITGDIVTDSILYVLYMMAFNLGHISITYDAFIDDLGISDDASLMFNVLNHQLLVKGLEDLEWVVLMDLEQIVDLNGQTISESQINALGELVVTFSNMEEIVIGKITDVYVVEFKDKSLNIITTQFVLYGYDAIAPIAPNVEGFTFKAWNLSYAKITSDLIILAQYDPINLTIVFDTNGGNTLEPVSNLLYGQTYAPPTPIKDGYQFVGWFYDQELTLSFNVDQGITSNITLYAKWEAVSEPTYTVTFETMGGLPLNDMVDILKDHTITPPTPVKEGYQFIGWFYDQELTSSFNVNQGITSSITLYAKWEAVSEPTYTVTFETMGGLPLNDMVDILKDHTITPPTPTKEGYLFIGWFYNQGLTLSFNVDQGITSNITLYAKWEAQEVHENHFYMVVNTQTSQTITIDVIIGGEVFLNGYDARIYFDASALSLTHVQNKNQNVVNSTQTGVILFNYSNIMQTMTNEKIILTLTFTILKPAQTTLEISVIEATYLTSNYQLLVAQTHQTPLHIGIGG